MSESVIDASSDPQPDIRAGDLMLRPWRADDEPQLMKAFGDPDISAWSGTKIASKEDAAAWIARWDAKWAAQSGASWAVTTIDQPTVVRGQVGLRTLWKGEMGELSYWVLPEFRGQGLAPKATRALALWALKDLDLTRVEIVHSVRNLASCLVACRAGFEYEGVKRSLQWHEIGGVHDMHLHSMVRPAETRLRTVDAALLGAASHVKLWLAISAGSAALMLLTLVSRLALLVPALVAVGVLGIYTGKLRRPRWQYERRARRRLVS